MGMYELRVQFDKEPPAWELVDCAMRELTGKYFVHKNEYDIDGNVVKVLVGMNPVTLPYLTKVMQDLGGVCLDWNGLPYTPSLPSFVSQPWEEIGWWRRFCVHFSFRLEQF